MEPLLHNQRQGMSSPFRKHRVFEPAHGVRIELVVDAAKLRVVLGHNTREVSILTFLFSNTRQLHADGDDPELGVAEFFPTRGDFAIECKNKHDNRTHRECFNIILDRIDCCGMQRVS